MLSMTTMEKPTTTPSPADMVNTIAAKNRRDYIYVPERSVDGIVRPVLGRVATRDEYRTTSTSDEITHINIDKSEDDFAAIKVTNDRESTDDKSISDLDGFTIQDVSQSELSEDLDEVPEDLEGELGEPDDEVKE